LGVAAEGAGADVGSACDVVEARSGAIAGEGFPGDLNDTLAVALGIGAGLAGGRRRRGLLFRHVHSRRKILFNRGLSPFYLAETQMSNSGAIFTGSVITAGGATNACICDGSNGFHWNGQAATRAIPSCSPRLCYYCFWPPARPPLFLRELLPTFHRWTRCAPNRGSPLIRKE
jgi:hypothetical protein